MKTELWSIGLVALASLVGSWGPIFFKKASKTLELNIKSIITNYNLIIGIFFYVCGTFLFIPALKGGELSVVYPLVALTYVWVSIWSTKFLGEKMNTLKWLGILLIISGVTLLGFGSA